jgi:hypothetical protein
MNVGDPLFFKENNLVYNSLDRKLLVTEMGNYQNVFLKV